MGLIYRKAKVTLNYLDEKPTVYKIQQVVMPAVKFSQLVKECSVSCGVSASQTKAVIDALVNRIEMYMQLGHMVQMGEFGSFKPEIRVKVAKKIDDANAETIRRKYIHFYPGASFREMLNKLEVEEAGEALNDEA